MDGIDIKFEFDQDDLKIVFKEYGDIVSIKIRDNGIAEIEFMNLINA